MTQADLTADQGLKARHRALWALGDYREVATDLIPTLGERVVEAAGVTAGQRVLDVAAGAGNAAIPAARRGAEVVASDLTPELLESGRDAVGSLPIRWEVGDAEALPYGDGEFDAVVSCVGVMFAPHHQVAADELVRVCRPGGTISLLSWTPAGFIGQMFATMKPFAPVPPRDTQPPLLWGDEQHVRALLGDRARDVAARTELLTVDRFGSGEEFRDFFKLRYGPTIATYRAVAEDPELVAQLDGALVALARRHGVDGGTMTWEYLLLTARRV